MKILLTGGSGFIGRNIKEYWQDRYHVLSPSHRELDLLEEGAVEAYLKQERPDMVLHTANTNDVARPESPTFLLEYNLRMFCNLKRCSKWFGRMYYFGSGAEYDMRHYLPGMREEYFGTHIPADAYGFSKYLMADMAAGNIYDLRLFGVFGRYEEWKRRFISNMLYQNMTGQTMQMYQNRYFDYLYVKDLLGILEWFLFHEPKHHHYNVCSGQKISLLKLAELVRKETGQEAEIKVETEGLGAEYTGNNQRLRREMGEITLTPMRKSVRELADYYRTNGFG